MMRWNGAAGLVVVLACTATAVAKDPPELAAIKKLVAAESKAMQEGGDPAGLYTDTARIVTPTSWPTEPDRASRNIIEASYITDFKPSGIRAGLSRDGQSAWVTYSATSQIACESCESSPGPTVRGSELVVKVGAAWRVHAAMWSEGIPDAKIHKAAQAGKADALQTIVDADTGDASVRAAFATLIAKGFDPALAASKDLVAIGSAPKEMTVGGKGLVPFVNKNWVGKLTVRGPVLAMSAPSGNTAAVFANVDLEKTAGKKTFTVPFRWFVVFDKDAAGAWTPVHLHFAVAAP